VDAVPAAGFRVVLSGPFRQPVAIGSVDKEGRFEIFGAAVPPDNWPTQYPVRFSVAVLDHEGDETEIVLPEDGFSFRPQLGKEVEITIRTPRRRK
jgi:hypothetical protein